MFCCFYALKLINLIDFFLFFSWIHEFVTPWRKRSACWRRCRRTWRRRGSASSAPSPRPSRRCDGTTTTLSSSTRWRYRRPTSWRTCAAAPRAESLSTLRKWWVSTAPSGRRSRGSAPEINCFFTHFLHGFIYLERMCGLYECENEGRGWRI